MFPRVDGVLQNSCSVFSEVPANLLNMNFFNGRFQGFWPQLWSRHIADHLFAENIFLCNTSRRLLLLVTRSFYKKHGCPYHIEISPLICSTNQWTGFYMIGIYVLFWRLLLMIEREKSSGYVWTSIKIYNKNCKIISNSIQLFIKNSWNLEKNLKRCINRDIF